MQFFIQRMREPSTWAGLASVLMAFGLGIPPGTVEAVAQVGMGVAGLVAVFVREKGAQ